MSCSKARVSSACFWLCSAIFSLNFLGLEELLEPGDPDIMKAARVYRATSQQKTKQNKQTSLAVCLELNLKYVSAVLPWLTCKSFWEENKNNKK